MITIGAIGIETGSRFDYRVIGSDRSASVAGRISRGVGGPRRGASGKANGGHELVLGNRVRDPLGRRSGSRVRRALAAILAISLILILAPAPPAAAQPKEPGAYKTAPAPANSVRPRPRRSSGRRRLSWSRPHRAGPSSFCGTSCHDP